MGQYLIGIVALFFSVLVACTSGNVATPSPQLNPAATGAAPAASAGSGKWEEVLAAARKEGVVRVYALWGPDVRAALIRGFKDKYGIDLEFVPFGRGAEVITKVQAEQRAGLYLADAFGAGGPSLITIMKPAGLLASVEPLLILPEVLNPNAWRGGKIPFSDNEKSSIPMTITPNRFITYNKDLIREGELTSYKDLLKPQYKGKISLGDPTLTGTGNAFFTHLVKTWNLEEAKEFFKQLIQLQEGVVMRDYRLQVESVARGKYPIGLGVMISEVAGFMKLGAPIAQVQLKESVFVSHSTDVLGVPRSFAHPNGATVFVNWLLSKEGQTIFSRSSATPVLRSDVVVEGIDPILLLKPDENYYIDTEESIKFRGDMVEVAKQVFSAYGK
ncbi:MAG: extracellular solute-binding protein [Chloroflexi bacterium]|nr:extracellular solute-binding protein [Chloroflexota bacterium]